MSKSTESQRWGARPAHAALIRVAAVVTPVAVSLVFIHFASRVVTVPTSSLWLFLAWWVVLSAGATLVLVVFQRLTRRLLPLAALYRLSLVFPDEAPSRFKAALAAGSVATLETRLERVRDADAETTPVEAAALLLSLVAALDTHDKLTRGHADRVRAYSQMIGKELGLGAEQVDRLNWAALLHDVGKLEVPAEILQKPGKPTDEEWTVLRRHPEFGEQLVAPLREWLGEWAEAVGQHHERWDGKGYPQGKSGEEIAIAGRIVAVADVFDVITSARSYKEASAAGEGRAEVARCAGTQFDPRVVRAFLSVSLGRMRLAVGPLAWLSHAPILGRMPLSPALGSVSASVGAVTLAVSAGVVSESAAKPQDSLRQPPVRAAIQPDSPPAPRPPVRVSPVPGERSSLPAFGTGTSQEDEPSVRPSLRDPVPTPSRPDEKPNADLVADETANRAPVTAADEVTTPEDKPVTIDVLANDSDPDGDSLELLSLDPPERGWVTRTGAAVTYSPPPEAVGTAEFNYVAGDGHGERATGTVTVTIVAVGDAPHADDDAVSVVQGTSVEIDVIANDHDPDGEDLRLVGVGTPQAGTASVEGDDVVYTAPTGASGTTSFRYTVSDQSGAIAHATVTARILPLNSPPSFLVGKDPVVAENAGPQRLPAWVTGISAGPPDEARQVVSFGVSTDDPALFTRDGLPAISSDGTLTFTPASNTSGTATVTVVATDDGGVADDGSDTSDPQTFTISVLPVNTPPSFSLGANQVVAKGSGAHVVTGFVTRISSGPGDEVGQKVTFGLANDDPSLFAPGGQPAIGADGTLAYTPAPGRTGKATVTVTASDDGGTENGGQDTSAPQTFTISVLAVNSPPSFVSGGNISVLENAGPQTIAGWATGISAGPAGEAAQSVKFKVKTDNLALFSKDARPDVMPDGTLTFTPEEDANGTAVVTVWAVDDGGLALGGSDTSAALIFTITVVAVNSAPSFEIGDDQSVLENAGPQTVADWATAISAGPPDEASQTVTFLLSCDNPALFTGSPAIAPGGTLTFQPAPNANGTATVTVVAKDDGGTANGGQEQSAPQTFTITIQEVNAAPSFSAGTNQTVPEDAGPTSVAGWATGIDPGPGEPGQTVTFIVTNDNSALFAAGGEPTIDGNGTLSFTPAPDAHGFATVTVTAKDDGGTANGGNDTSVPKVFTITVTSVNDPPSAADDSASVDEDLAGGVTFTVLANDSDVDGDALVLASYDDSSLTGGSLTHNGGGSFSYVPSAHFVGSDSYTYVAGDGNGGTDTGTVAITVTPQPDPPDAAGDAYSTPQDTPLSVGGPGVLANDADLDGDALTVQTTAVAGPSNGILSLVADGSFVYTPNAGFSGTDSFTYRTDDGTGLTDDAIVNVTVNAAPTGPLALYLQPSGPSAEVWDLSPSPAPAASPVPDHDGDGDPGLWVKDSDGDAANPDPRESQNWLYAVTSPLVLNGPVTLQLWSTIEFFELGQSGHPYLYLYECDAGGAGCTLIAQNDIHVANWNGLVPSWVYREFTIGSVSRTIPAGNTLRVQLLFGHDDLWVALTTAYPSALVVTTG